ncbi:MAG: (2Fe-2S)-binding protein [Planctomycetes bacterium]|nr:(2Fe-2S)-binding protein [Planctomycetota bacterium]
MTAAGTTSTSFDLAIDGRTVPARPGETLLAAARRAGIEVPTLCFLDGLRGYGACRLCAVEVSPGGSKVPANGGGKIVASCAHPAAPGLDVRTRSDRLDRIRRGILDLLLARCPASGEVKEMADRFGVRGTSFPPDLDRDRCILCGTCVRVCEAVGPRAISAAGRGPGRLIATPFGEPSPDCIGCLSCAKACPTKNIAATDDGLRRTIWGRSFERVPCPGCGKPGATAEQIAYYVKTYGWEEETLVLCDACKRAKTTRTFFGLMRM